MARITRIQTSGLRARDFDLSLGRFTLVTGDWGTGKTSIADAVRIAALGYVPSIGRTEADTARLMSDRELHVALTLEDDRTVGRSLKRHRGGFKKGARASWVDPKATMTEHAKKIVAAFGSSKLEVEENLDLRALLNASPNERAQRLEEILEATAATPTQIANRLQLLMHARLIDRPPEDVFEAANLDELLGSMRTLIDPAMHYHLDAQADALGAILKTNGLAAALEHAGQQKNREAQALKNRRAARTELEDRVAGEAPPAFPLSELRGKRESLVEERAAIRERMRLHLDASQTVSAALRAYEAAQKDATYLPAMKDEVGRLEASRDAIVVPEVADLNVVPYRDPQAVEEARAAVQTAADAVGPAPEAPVEPDARVHGQATHEHRKAEEALEKLEASPWSTVLDLAATLLACAYPEIKAIGQSLVNLAREHTPDRVAIEEGVVTCRAHAQRAFADLNAARTRYHEQLSAHRAEMAAWTARAEAAERANHRLQAELHQAKQAYDVQISADTTAHNGALAQQLEARLKRDAYSKALDIKRDAILKMERHVGRSRERLEAAQNAIQPLDTDRAEQDMSEKGAEIELLDVQIDALERSDARTHELQSITAEIAKATNAWECAQAAEWALQCLRARDMGQRGAPILLRLTQYLAAAGREEIPYFDVQERQVDFGWLRGDQRIHVAAMSGGEAALFSAGLAASIVALRQPSCRVLLVEAAEIGQHAGEMMRGLSALETELDTVIVSTIQNAEHERGWERIHLEAE